MIIIYATEKCPACKLSKLYCEIRSIPHEYKFIGQDATPDQLTLLAGVPIRSAPAIFEQDGCDLPRYIGGYKELREHTKRPITSA